MRGEPRLATTDGPHRLRRPPAPDCDPWHRPRRSRRGRRQRRRRMAARRCRVRRRHRNVRRLRSGVRRPARGPACRHLVRGGGHPAVGSDHRLAVPRNGSAGARRFRSGQRRLRRRRHLRRPSRQDPRAARDRRRQHPQRRPGSITRRRRGHRLHDHRLHPHRSHLRRRRGPGREPSPARPASLRAPRREPRALRWWHPRERTLRRTAASAHRSNGCGALPALRGHGPAGGAGLTHACPRRRLGRRLEASGR